MCFRGTEVVTVPLCATRKKGARSGLAFYLRSGFLDDAIIVDLSTSLDICASNFAFIWVS